MKAFAHIFLHVGLHKTGTSTLQEFLYTHRDKLRTDNGVLYPALQANLSQPLSSLFSEAPASYPENVLRGIDTEEKVRAQNALYLAALEQEFRSTAADRLILSAEDVCLLSQTGLKRLRAWLSKWSDNLSVVCVLREPASWATSAAQSRIRGGATIEEVNEDHRVQRLKPLLEGLVAAFGAEHMLWLDFQRLVRHPENYVAGFLQALGMDAGWLREQSVRLVNESMSQEAAQVVSAINSLKPLYVNGKLNPERWHNDIGAISQSIPGRRFRLREDTLTRIREDEKPLLNWLQAQFGFCFASPDCGTEAYDAQASEISMGQSAVELLSLYAHELERLKVENRRLQESLRDTKSAKVS